MNPSIILKRWKSNIVTYKKNRNNERDYSIWIFGEWFGKKCSDNSLAFANYVAENSSDDLKLFWLCDDGTDTSELHQKVTVIDRLSSESIELQKKAGVAVMNQGFDDFSNIGDNYLGNAITVNLWHGVMWKKIGFDSYTDNVLSKIYITSVKESKSCKIFCSPSSIYTHFFANAFRVEKKCAINAGLPRNSIFFNENELEQARKIVLKKISEFSKIVNEDTKIITYMPTFRDKNMSTFSFKEYKNIELDDFLEKNNCIIVQKAHQVNVKRGKGFGTNAFERIINLDDVHPQKLLAATNVLITDYSSCFFDYLLLDRPIIQFLYDYEYYSKKDRGLYYDSADVDCGKMIFSEAELFNGIKEAVYYPKKYSKKRKLVRNKFMEYETKDSNKTIYNHIIKEISLVKEEV
ncbi:CDP-glycerol glycerophosphotransferase [Lachnospiraceae bacterium RM5]|nr:CDP-glycerol glycerophosphotransferase [Lachnospiraceae bacterium RM5]